MSQVAGQHRPKPGPALGPAQVHTAPNVNTCWGTVSLSMAKTACHAHLHALLKCIALLPNTSYSYLSNWQRTLVVADAPAPEWPMFPHPGQVTCLSLALRGVYAPGPWANFSYPASPSYHVHTPFQCVLLFLPPPLQVLCHVQPSRCSSPHLFSKRQASNPLL